MRTEGRVFVGAEVRPEVKDKICARAAVKRVSQAEVVRDILDAYFAFSQHDMDDMKRVEGVEEVLYE